MSRRGRRTAAQGRPARQAPAPQPMSPWAGHWVESGPTGDEVVRPVSGAAATKSYRCPGCDQQIPPGTPHVVAWPDGAFGGPADRRHWHSPCWSARGRRQPRTLRSRDASRY